MAICPWFSATEGADSKPNTQPGTPTEEQPGQIGAVTTKMTQGVKSFGSFLYSSAHKAGEKIKKTVDSHVSNKKIVYKEWQSYNL